MKQPPHGRVWWRGGLAAGVLALGACSRSAPPAAADGPAAPPAKSTADLVVDGVTGRTAIQAGQKARATIEKVNTERESDMAEVDKF